jgi:hypothetical protein
MALSSPPLEPFNYNGDHFCDSFLDNGDDMALSSLLSGSIDYSSFGANYSSTPNNSTYSTSSFLNFNQEDECDMWIDAMDQNNCVSKYQNGNEMMNGCSLINGAIGEKRCCENRQFVFPYPSSSHIDYVQESLKQEKISRKRSYEVSVVLTQYNWLLNITYFVRNLIVFFLQGVEMQMPKKQCDIERKTKAKSLSPSKAKSVSLTKAKSLSPSKEPQSHAAKVS